VVVFTLSWKDLSFYGIDISRGPVSEPGRFTVMVGRNPSEMLVAGFDLVAPSAAAGQGH
jgi:hypothetical protein